MKKILFAFFLLMAIPILTRPAAATVSVNNARDTYTGNGTATAYTYTFRILSSSHISVYVAGVLKTLTTDYTVSGVGNSTGTITFVSAPANAASIIFLRNVPLSQQSDYIANEAFPANRIENDFDRVYMSLQQINERLNRTLTAPVTSGALASLTPVASAAIGFNATADGFETFTRDPTTVSGAANQVFRVPSSGSTAGSFGSINLASSAAVGSSILALANGGTGANLSATGGANQFVRQNSAGGVFTVSAIADADVPNTITLDNITQVTTRNHSSLQNLTSGDDHTQYTLLAGRGGGQNLALGSKTSPSYSLDTDGSINLPQSASHGLRFGGTALMINALSTSPGTLQFHPTGNSVTSSLHLLPTTGTLPTGTLSEFVIARTTDQAFGGNYGRWSFTAYGTDQGSASAMHGEFGGSVTPTEFLFSMGVENPASTFTSYEPMRLMAGSDIGSVGFCISNTDKAPKECLKIISENIGSTGTRDSHSILMRGKSNDGSEHAVDWKFYNDVASNAGASMFTFQNRIDSAGYATHLQLESAASAVNHLRITPSATGGNVTLSAQGSDSNIPLLLTAKGASGVALVSNTTTAFNAVGVGASGVNYLQSTNSASASPVILSAQGSDSNIQINIVPKGSSGVNIAGPLTAINGNAPFNGTKTVRASGGASDCTLVFTTGVLTGGTC